MAYDFNLIENCSTLSYYDYLKKHRLDPELAVYQGKTLWIVSYKTDSLLEKIRQLFISFQECILLCIGDLSYDTDKILEIKLKVNKYHSKKCASLIGFFNEFNDKLDKTSLVINQIDKFVALQNSKNDLRGPSLTAILVFFIIINFYKILKKKMKLFREDPN